MDPLRFRPSPSTVLAGLALFFALGGSAFAVGNRVLGGSAALKAQQRCATGAIKGIAVVQDVNVASQFTSNPGSFARRFNCTGKGVQARKVSTGVFEVRFAGIRGDAVGAVLSQDAGSLSIQPVPQPLPYVGFQVRIRGVGTLQNLLPPVDSAFVVVVI